MTDLADFRMGPLPPPDLSSVKRRLIEELRRAAMVRAKFKCDLKKADYVSFSPVYSGSEENKEFFKATPGGQIQMHVVNEKAMAAFEEGKEYYIDFTPAGTA